ncbi:ABC transporter substrate-binding protein [Fusibacter ferrireducens]|uniref:Solute-binding protein family 5 domain-containing protein n=1 Tax=Fusibacter ferrireducens TaxID=2785058 RepID=A0ABR9ZYA8_9FIRM|nr:ABC transporter substrate-binding protein [Fusibacter ferrireducens]MBF4694951.1 hypothetical protein [Fusibacter ferrireducens]
MKRRLGIIILATLMLFTVGCEVNKNRIEMPDNRIVKEAVHDNELRYGLWSAPSGVFAPQYEKSDYDDIIMSLAYEPLVMINPSNEYEGILAERWTLSEDQKTMTFFLRKNVKWHDGEPFTANDVLFSLKYIAHPQYDGEKYVNISAIEGIEDYHNGNSIHIKGIEIVDDLTIKITTKAVYAPVLEQIGDIKIFPEHIWKDVDIEHVYENEAVLTTTIGTGPYTVESVTPNQDIRLVRYSNYWGGEPKIERIAVQIMSSETAQIKMINGQLDVMQIASMAPNDLQLYEDAGVRIEKINYNSFQNMTLNTENRILKNTYVRQALTMAIDRESIVETLIFGYGNVSNTVYKQDSWVYPEDYKINKYPYNPDRALRKLISNPDFVYKENVLYYENEPVVLSLIYPSGNKARELSASVIQENLSRIGIDVVLTKVEFNDLLDLMRTGQYEMALIGNGFALDPDVSTMFSTDSISFRNYSRFSNEKLDQLLDMGVTTLDKLERQQIYEEVAILINKQMPIIFLYNWTEGRAISARLRGAEFYPYNYFYRVHEWYFEE